MMAYVERVLNWPVPKTVKSLNTFLGFVSYYRTFIEKFSKLTNEMHGQKKNVKLTWTAVMDRKFKELKEEFSKRPIRAYPNYDGKEPFQLAVDFSAENLGAVLSQVQEDKERMIATAGRKTTTYERNYSSVKGELSALVYGLRKF